MAHQHSSSQPVRHSTRRNSSKKDADLLYSEQPGQWQDFNFPDAEFLQPAITKQGAAEAEKSFPSAQRTSSATADDIRSSSTRDLELQIRLTEAQNQKLALELEVLELRRADGSAAANSCTQPAATKTRKKRTVDWPHEFAPGNYSSGDYDTSVRSFHGYIAKQVELWRLEWTSLSEIREKANTYLKHSDLRSSQLRPTIPSILSSPSVVPSRQQRSSRRDRSVSQSTPWLLALGSLHYGTFVSVLSHSLFLFLFFLFTHVHRLRLGLCVGVLLSM